MTEKVKPSIFRIIQSDYLALIGILFPVVIFIFYVAVMYLGFFPGIGGRDPIQGRAGAPALLYTGIAGLVIGFPLAFWRIRSIQQRFSKGVEVVGQVTWVSFYRDRGNVAYSYTHQGQTYTGSNAIMKTGQTQKLREGTQVIVLVDPDQPKKALIRDLYV